MSDVALGALLFLGFHFAGTYLVPANGGKAKFYWPWTYDAAIWARLGDRGSLVPIRWPVLQPLAVVAALAYLGALLALFGWLVPTGWLLPLAVVGAVASLLLYALHPGVFGVIPILVDVVVLGGGAGPRLGRSDPVSRPVKGDRTENSWNVARAPSPPDRGAWVWLYRTGGIAAVATALLIPIAIIAHVLWPPPPWEAGAAGDWFTYIQGNRLAGLLNLDLPLAVGLVLAIPLYLALYVILARTNQSAMIIATAIAFLSTVLHLCSITVVEMLAFSDAYAVATTDAQRAVYLTAGEVALAAYYGTVFQVSYVLGYLVYVVLGTVMLRSAAFGRAIAFLGIATGIAGLGFYLPTIGPLLSVLTVLLIGVWNALVARELFRLERSAG